MDVQKIIERLRIATKALEPPASVTIVSRFERDSFLVLISCILSLRTRDTVSLPASLRLFAQARTPEKMLEIPAEQIAKIIYPVGFYRRKALTIHKICNELLTRYEGKVPNTLKELMALPGVGLKTANLVLGEGFGIPAIVVDTHVHRISNRLGLVKTKTPEETEAALRKILPQKYWIEWGRLLVMLGQNVCVPISPFCSMCPIRDMCKRVGVVKSR